LGQRANGRSCIAGRFRYNGLRFGRMKMKLLLINCYREQARDKIAGYRDWLRAGAEAAAIGLEIREDDDARPGPAGRDADAVVLSGSQKMVGDNEAGAPLLEFLAGWGRPLLGICFGHQALARACGATVRRDGTRHLGAEEVRAGRPQGLFAGFPAAFPMHESHEEIVARDAVLERDFRVLAESGAGLVEAIAHRRRPLYGVQFHPERSGEFGVKLLVNFLRIVQHEAENHRDA
jgi:GMP synthase-like glutamine amidotransferase